MPKEVRAQGGGRVNLHWTYSEPTLGKQLGEEKHEADGQHAVI